MKKNFISGVVLLLPVVLTVAIISFLINIITRPFQTFTEALLQYSSFFHNHPFWAALISKVIILSLLITLIFLFGIFGTHYLIDSFLKKTDRLLDRIPLINKLYKATQEVTKTFFHQKETSFTQVVLIPFPQKNQTGIGFVTASCVNIAFSPEKTENYVSVFIPGAPNPTTGFLLLYKQEHVNQSHLKIDEAMKFIISFGTSMPEPQFTFHENKPLKETSIV